MNADLPEALCDADGAESLRRIMADATGHLAGVRVDTVLLRHRRRVRRVKGSVAMSGALAAVAAGALCLPRSAGPGHGSPPVAASTGSPAVAPTGSPTGSPAGRRSTPLAGSPNGPLGTPANDVFVYDADDGSEGKDSASSVLIPGGSGWSTRIYCQSRPTGLGRAKPGTGLVFGLAAPTGIQRVEVAIRTPGATMEMWAAPEGQSGAPAVVPGAPPAGFTKVATASATGTEAVFTPDRPVTAKYFLIWFTALPPVAPADDVRTVACASGAASHYGDAILAMGYRAR